MGEEFAPKLILWLHPFRISCREDSQDKRASIQMLKTRKWFRKSNIYYTLGDPCYALYFGPRRDRDPRWMPALVTKVHGARSVNVRVIPRGPTCRRHLDRLRPRYASDQDDDPCEIPTSVLSTKTLPAGTDHASSSSSMNHTNRRRVRVICIYFFVVVYLGRCYDIVQ